jgi:hypothetical protein
MAQNRALGLWLLKDAKRETVRYDEPVFQRV